MHSELVAVNLAGQLCQWRWNDLEPHCNEVRWFNIKLGISLFWGFWSSLIWHLGVLYLEAFWYSFALNCICWLLIYSPIIWACACFALLSVKERTVVCFKFDALTHFSKTAPVFTQSHPHLVWRERKLLRWPLVASELLYWRKVGRYVALKIIDLCSGALLRCPWLE